MSHLAIASQCLAMPREIERPCRRRPGTHRHRQHTIIECSNVGARDLLPGALSLADGAAWRLTGGPTPRRVKRKGPTDKERRSPAAPCKAANRPLCSSDRHLAGLSGRFALADRWAQVQIFSKHRRSGLNVALFCASLAQMHQRQS